MQNKLNLNKNLNISRITNEIDSQYRGLIIRIVFPLVALLLAVGIPFLGSTTFVLALAIIPVVIMGLSRVSKWIGIGMAVIVFSAVLVDFQIGTGTGTSINAAMITLAIMVGMWVINVFILRQRVAITSMETFIPLILFLVFGFISFLSGQIAWYSFAEETSVAAQLGGLSIFIFSALAYWWVATQVDELYWLKTAVITLMVVSSIYFLSRTFPFSPFIDVGRYVVRGAAGSMLFVWGGCMALAQGLVNKNLKTPVRALCLIVPAVAFYVAFFQLRGWVSGYLPLLAVFVIVYWLAFPKQGVFIGLVVFGAGLTQLQSILETYVFIGDNEYSLGTRLDAWRIVGEITSISPILGLGPANYYNITPLFPIRGYAVQFNSHSQYVDLYAQTGIIGIILFFLFFWQVWNLGWRLRSTVKAESFEQAYVIGAMGGVVGTLVSAALGDWVIPFVYNIGFGGFRASVLCWLFLGGLVSIKRIYALRADNEEPAPILEAYGP